MLAQKNPLVPVEVYLRKTLLVINNFYAYTESYERESSRFISRGSSTGNIVYIM